MFPPFAVAGPSLSGKSSLILKIVEHRQKLMSHDPKKILYITETDGWRFRKQYIEKLQSLSPNVYIQEGLNFNRLGLDNEEEETATLIILDDVHIDFSSENILQLFTKMSHHRFCSLIITMQVRTLRMHRSLFSMEQMGRRERE